MADEGMRLAAEGVAATPFEIPGATGEFRIQILNEDAGRGVVTSIVHLPPGGRIPAHMHKAGSDGLWEICTCVSHCLRCVFFRFTTAQIQGPPVRAKVQSACPGKYG